MIDPRIWLFWAFTMLVAASEVRNPLYILWLLLVAWIVEIRWALHRGQKIPWSFRWGVLLIPLAGLFNGMSVRIGETVLLRLPSWLPLMGGPITLEALVYGVLNGMALTIILSAFLTFNRATPARDMVRIVPKAFYEAGVILSIALTFFPLMLRTVQDIREAQMVRGHRIRGLRDWLAIWLPLLMNGLERAVRLAEAMVARGYGAPFPSGSPMGVQFSLAGGLTALLGGWLVRLFVPQHRDAGLGVLLLGVGLILGTVWWVGHAHPRTGYRNRSWTLWDGLIGLGCGVAAWILIDPFSWVDPQALYYSPYPRLLLPDFHPWVGLGLLGLLIPAFAKRSSEID
ncbi:MAG: energy-coupling factor transporter transmembrane component T [Anaerolineae bacterium]|nr:energy-coupling factor transporter transmembrane protein EcfT [Anaerolineae bacterium]MDW8067593.1 energy-coupling factor transporter transmembrane component T [Anaerolineae bacterium]